MKINKWILRLSVTSFFIVGILVVIILKPMLTYAHETTHGNFSIYHDQVVDQHFFYCADNALQVVEESALYDKGLKIDICLNDGSVYPRLMRTIRGQAFGWGFYNKVVLMGVAKPAENYVELNGYKWNLTQLLAHELIHCYQFNSLGLWDSNPVARIPDWKWEGYPEYVARQNPDQLDLLNNITRLIRAEQTDNNGWIQFADSTGTVIPYYKSWLLMQYCMNIKKMSYEQVLHDSTGEGDISIQMMNWYHNNGK